MTRIEDLHERRAEIDSEIAEAEIEATEAILVIDSEAGDPGEPDADDGMEFGGEA